MSRNVPTHWKTYFGQLMTKYPFFEIIGHKPLDKERRCILPGLEIYELEYLFFAEGFEIIGVINDKGSNFIKHTRQYAFQFHKIVDLDEFVVTFTTYVGHEMDHLTKELFYKLFEFDIVIDYYHRPNMDLIALKRSWLLNQIINH